MPDKAPKEPSDDCGERDSPRRLEAQAMPKKKTTGQLSIRQMFGKARLAVRTDEMPGTEEQWPWTFCLRLSNPHQLCYMNAGITSLLHASQGVRLVELAGIEALCRQHAESGQLLVLSRQLVIRSRLPRWDFGPTQRDVSEFLLSFLSEGSTSWFRWEARQERRESARVVDTGDPVLFLEVPSQAIWTPTLAFERWSEAASVRAISRVGRVLIVQIGRYINGAKDTSRVDLTSDVLVPEFDEGVAVRWHTYRVQAVVLHLGARPTAGHYRALLRAGDQWGYSDDGVRARVVDMAAEFQRNAYMLFLIRSSQA